MRIAFPLLLPLAALTTLLAPVPSSGQAPADSAAFVTRLGDDTLVVERFVRTPARVEATVVIRVPRTQTRHYVLELDAAGRMTRLERRIERPGAATQVITRTAADSLRVEYTGDDAQARTIGAPAEVLPFLDMVHWPFELVLMRARHAGADVRIPLLSGERSATFHVGIIGRDSMTITHPTRGTMLVRVDDRGRLLGLDAGATTRKLVVERRPWFDVAPVSSAWAALDAAGRSMGDLSGRNRARFSVAGAQFTVDHGTPAARGREIWGALVPWGQVWRTGANQATHFSTDRDLVLGTGGDTLRVPAGRYTLFSVPERGGGVLIVNRETGQTGTAYDPAHDLGRVRMSAQPLAPAVEVFDIAVTDEGGGAGALRLRWDRQQMVVPLRVR